MTRRSLPLTDWPPTDRARWEAATTARASLWDDAGAGTKLSPHTLRLYLRAYGRWLAFLRSQDLLIDTPDLARRAVPERLSAWIAAMRRDGNRDNTIGTTMMSLHAAFRMLEPDSDTGHILRPGGRPLVEHFPQSVKPFDGVDLPTLMDKVRALHVEGLARGAHWTRWAMLRDAAMIGLVLTYAPRIGNVIAMQLGEHLLPAPGDRYLVRFPAGLVKSRRAVEFELDAERSLWMSDYLTLARPYLGKGTATSAVWLNYDAAAVAYDGASGIFRRRTRAWLGKAYGPHMARKWLRSAAAEHCPTLALDAAEVLGHSPQISLRHYSEANSRHASRRHGAALRALRRESEGIAARSFGEDDV